MITGAGRGVVLGLDGAEVGIPCPTDENPGGLKTTSLLVPETDGLITTGLVKTIVSIQLQRVLLYFTMILYIEHHLLS